MTTEHTRLQETKEGKAHWRYIGPYLTDRQWGTVREDYSPYGNAWEFVSHDMARSKAYRWGEEGIAGISDDQQRLCFALAFWNGHDPILKERLFGLTGNEGNHAEDVKEHYYYLDSTPTHSYMKMLYKYPQAAFPYAWLVDENRRRSKQDPEFELIDTGVFDENRYFDIFIEYAKVNTHDILIQVTAHNRGSEDAPLHILPQVWFRNTWAWGYNAYRPSLNAGDDGSVDIHHRDMGTFTLYAGQQPTFLFCDNETNSRRLYGVPGTSPYPKDAINDYLVQGNKQAPNPTHTGTKAAAHYPVTVPAGQSVTVKLRLAKPGLIAPFDQFDAVFRQRAHEADEFYRNLQQDIPSEDARRVQRQAFAGMLWSKQFYYFDIPQWLNGDPAQPAPPPERKHGRNNAWFHLNNADVISMPDKWEYPWYAAWDLAFHCLPLALVDAEFAKHQLLLLTKEWYMHPNGQLPAYEWQFSDVNPPVHAWATWRVYKIDQKQNGGQGDVRFLEEVYHKLLLNFTWWVNQKDKNGLNIFQGGFLGLDNIGVFDRSAELPTGGFIEQADGTSWMAMYSLNLMRIALELSKTNPTYQGIATKFFEHFLYIAGAMSNVGNQGINLWDDEDEFFYDVLHTPNNERIKLKVRSMVGLIPLFAVEVLDDEILQAQPEFANRLRWFLENRPELASLVSRWQEPGKGERHLLSLLRGHRMKKLLKRMLDETEFLSAYGIRALSRYHHDHPYEFWANGNKFTVTYQPGESDSGLFGGNSNWRGPIWFPVNYLLIESLQRFHHYYGDDFKVEYPTGSGQYATLNEIAQALANRLAGIFLTSEDGRRPVFGHNEKLQNDPHFRDYLWFYEYFHGDNGRGVGASHQTGWTGLIAKLIHPRRTQAIPQEVPVNGSAKATQPVLS
ncbi:glucosidase [Nibrella viscosa]|uniref:Glucosidase n=1 Tax=Nibrella viscosa TaxID=1084524 RepID=A0ABP8KUR8_9BACT